MIEPVFQDTILQFYDRLAEMSVLWVVTGSLGMALQGMPVTVHDIDLQTDAAGAYKIAHIFAGHISPYQNTGLTVPFRPILLLIISQNHDMILIKRMIAL